MERFSLSEIQAQVVLDMQLKRLQGLEREKLEAQEAAARARLARIERTGAINQLCAMIAHELKQPMSSVINYMTVLKIRLADRISEDDIVSRAVSGAEEETRRMAAIVDRVRGYARRTSTAATSSTSTPSSRRPSPATRVTPRARAGSRSRSSPPHASAATTSRSSFSSSIS